MLLPAYAKKFAENGFVALTFDYRGFGGSGGERNRIGPKLQIEDIKSAITFLMSYPEVDPDRIGLWGTSYGGANAIIAASEDKRIKCLCVQLAFGDGERVVTIGKTLEEINKLKETILKLRDKKESTGKELMVPIIKILSDDQSKEYFQKHSNEFPNLKEKIPFLTVFETMQHKPEERLKDVDIPILIVGAEQDIVNPISESYSLYEKAKEPKELLIIEGASHFDVYSGDYFVQAVNKQISWFNKHL